MRGVCVLYRKHSIQVPSLIVVSLIKATDERKTSTSISADALVASRYGQPSSPTARCNILNVAQMIIRHA
jgi:hypothetical protein